MNGAFKRERAEDLRFLPHKNVMCSSLASTHLIQQRKANKATECIMFLQVKQVKLLTAHLAPGVKFVDKCKVYYKLAPHRYVLRIVR